MPHDRPPSLWRACPAKRGSAGGDSSAQGRWRGAHGETMVRAGPGSGPTREKRRMKGILIRWLVLTAAIMVTSYLLEGIEVAGFSSAFFAAAILGVLNAFFRPVLLVLTLPINILSLGLFTFVINAMLLKMASGLISGFEVRGFWSAVFGSLLISLVSWLLSSFISDRGRVEHVRHTKYIDMTKTDKDKWE
jgi:putative membrane protein